MYYDSMLKLILILTLISLLFGLPHIIGLINNKPYVSTVVVGVTPYSFDENHYAARIQKSYSDGLSVSDAYTYEYRQGPYIFPTFSTLVLDYIARITGSVQNLFIVADFIFPPLLFLVLFFLIYCFTQNQIISLTGTTFILLEDLFLGHFLPLFNSLASFSYKPFLTYLGNITSPPFYSRLENPEFTGIFFFLCLICFYRIFNRSCSLKVYLLFALVLLTLVYS